MHAPVEQMLENAVTFRAANPKFSFGMLDSDAHRGYYRNIHQITKYILQNRSDQVDAVQREGLEAVIDLAIHVHGAERRKTGPLYLTHPLDIARGEADIGAEWSELLVAILHDAGEERVKRDPQIRKLKERRTRATSDGAEELRLAMVRRSARVVKQFLTEIGETLEEVLDRRNIQQPLTRDRYRRQVERVQFGIYQMTRLEGLSEGEYLHRLLYGQRHNASGVLVPTWGDLQRFIRDPSEHPWGLYLRQLAALKLKDNTANIQETPRKYRDPNNRYTVAEMNYLTFKYTTVVAAVQHKISRLRRNDVQRERLAQNCDALLDALRTENARDIAFLEQVVLTQEEVHAVRQNVRKYVRTPHATKPQKPRYDWQHPATAVTDMASVYRQLVEGMAVRDPFFPIEGYTFRNWRTMNGDKRWFEELAEVQSPAQQERGVHLVVYQDALLNRFTFNNRVRHLAYLDVAFGRRWR